MAQIPTDYRKLQNAFRQHKLAVEKAGEVEEKDRAPYNLLLFYAVECGLKSIYLKRNGSPKKGTKPDSTPIEEIGHDLILLAKKLGLAKRLAKKPDLNHQKTEETELTFRSLRQGEISGPWGIKKIHEAWRYGVKIDYDDEQEIIKRLKELCIYIQTQLA